MREPGSVSAGEGIAISGGRGETGILRLIVVAINAEGDGELVRAVVIDNDLIRIAGVDGELQIDAVGAARNHDVGEQVTIGTLLENQIAGVGFAFPDED